MAERRKPRRAVSIDAELVEAVRAEAYRRVVGPSLLVDRFIRYGLENLPPMPGDTPRVLDMEEHRDGEVLVVNDPQAFARLHRDETGHTMAVVDAFRASCAECDWDVVLDPSMAAELRAARGDQ